MQKKSIKNIYLYPINNKFNKNLFDMNDEHIKVIPMPTNMSIFKYFYTNDYLQNTDLQENKPVFIINSSLLNDEIISFIQGASEFIKFWIFIDSNFSIDEKLNAKYIVENNTEISPNKNIRYIPPNIVNKNLYENIKVNKKIDQIVYFFDPNSRIDHTGKLMEYLYPATKLRIKMFDNESFNNPQNLGLLSEQTRQRVLLESKFYLHDDSNYYLTESLLCDCIPINIERDEAFQTQQINNVCNKPNKINYYIDFLKEISDE